MGTQKSPLKTCWVKFHNSNPVKHGYYSIIGKCVSNWAAISSTVVVATLFFSNHSHRRQIARKDIVIAEYCISRIIIFIYAGNQIFGTPLLYRLGESILACTRSPKRPLLHIANVWRYAAPHFTKVCDFVQAGQHPNFF